MHNDSLVVFAKVVEYKSFSATSRVLYMSPVAIRKHIDKLEKNLVLVYSKEVLRVLS